VAKVQTDEQLQAKYADKAGYNLYQFIQYLVVSVWGYKVLKSTKHLPWFMGGDSDAKTAFESCFIGNPFTEFPHELYEWFLYSAGIYFGELFNHVLFAERRNDFGEMLIHHMATCFLVFGSAYSNYTGIGAIISWIHLVSDVTGSLVKCFASTYFNESTVVVFFVMMTSWFYFRLLCLPFWIINIFFNPIMGYPDEFAEYDIFITLNGLYLTVLQFLQVYWFSLFIKMLLTYRKTGVAEDTQEQVETTEKEKT